MPGPSLAGRPRLGPRRPHRRRGAGTRRRAAARCAPQPGVVAGAIDARQPGAAGRSCARCWEQVNNRWNQWVLNYSRAQQFDLLQNLGVRTPTWEDLAYLLAGLLSVGERGRRGLGLVGPASPRPLAAPAFAHRAAAGCARHRLRSRTMRHARWPSVRARSSVPPARPLAAELDALDLPALRPQRALAARPGVVASLRCRRGERNTATIIRR